MKSKKLVRSFSVLLALVMMLATLPVAALAEDEVLHDDCLDHADHALVAGELPVEVVPGGDVSVASWPWTDCTNILGHSWTPPVPTARMLSSPNLDVCYVLITTISKTCKNCGVLDSSTTVTDKGHSWIYSHNIMIGGEVHKLYKCEGICGQNITKLS